MIINLFSFMDLFILDGLNRIKYGQQVLLLVNCAISQVIGDKIRHCPNG